jgi:hypothetical protein
MALTKFIKDIRCIHNPLVQDCTVQKNSKQAHLIRNKALQEACTGTKAFQRLRTKKHIHLPQSTQPPQSIVLLSFKAEVSMPKSRPEGRQQTPAG